MSLVSGKGQINKFNQLQTPKRPLEIFFFFLVGKNICCCCFSANFRVFREAWGREWKAKMWEVTVLPGPRLSEPLPANYTTEFGSRAPFIKLLGVLEGKGQNCTSEVWKAWCCQACSTREMHHLKARFNPVKYYCHSPVC